MPSQQFTHLPRYTCQLSSLNISHDMSTSVRVAVVTGSNKGIGLAIVRSLCKKFTGDVYLTARDEGRGLEAVALLNAEGLGPKFHQLDITSQDSVDALKKFIADKYGGIDVLVNNAGVAFKHSSTASDIEQATVMCSIDFTGTQNMLRTFTPLLKPHGRIVTVAAWNGHLSRLQCADLRNRFSSPSLTEAELVSLVEEFISDVRAGKHKGKWCNTFYSSTKVAEIALTKVYAREIAKSGKEDVLINCCCPGHVRTDMAGPNAPLSPDEGAETPVLLALLPAGSPNGEFWKDKAVIQW